MFTLLADGYPATDIKVKCLLKWTGTKVIGCIDGKHLTSIIKLAIDEKFTFCRVSGLFRFDGA